jgi:hypothetical protein
MLIFMLHSTGNITYRITAILKVETDIIANISTSPIGRAVIFVTMSVKPSELKLLFLSVTL